jgi:hypothetical protein
MTDQNIRAAVIAQAVPRGFFHAQNSGVPPMARLIFALLFMLGLSSPAGAQQFINAYQVGQPVDVMMTLLGYGTSITTIQAAGGATLTAAFRVSDDGTNWTSITGYPVAGGAGATSITGDGYWAFATAGHRFLQVHVTAITGIEYFTLVGSPGGLVPSPNGPAQSMTPAPCAWSYASVTLTAATSATILAAGNYKSVILMDVGSNPVDRFAAGTSPITASSPGFALDPPSNKQGGSFAFPLPPTNAVQAISTLGTTVTVAVCS